MSIRKTLLTYQLLKKQHKENAIIAKEKEAADLRKKYFGPEGEGMKKRQETDYSYSGCHIQCY
mgnify:CR=1 FL=1